MEFDSVAENLSIVYANQWYTYSAYSLIIQAFLPLPELVSVQEAGTESQLEPDVTIRMGRLASFAVEASAMGRDLRITADGIYLFWDKVGSFLVRDGREIIVDPLPGVAEHVLRLFILGTTMAMLLHQRRETIVLHASVVAISGQAVAFVGVKGAGKSTMAATLQARGHALMADDILAVRMGQNGPLALSGFPHLKLWPDSLAVLGHDPQSLPQLRPELEKRGHRLTAGFSTEVVPLRCIYMLNLGPESSIETFPPQQAWAILMPHWYGARFGSELLQALGLSSHFLQCATLAKQVPICRLSRPAAFAALPNVARLVEAHAARDFQLPEGQLGILPQELNDIPA